MRLEDVDLTNLDYFAANQGYPMFDVLREEAPVFWNPEQAPNHGFWAITRHGDIQKIDRDAETFTSEQFVNLEEVDDDLMEIRRSLLETDGTRHRAMRRLLQRDFGAQSLKIYEEYLRGLTKVTLDAALPKGTFDFVKSVSADFPIRVLARMLDVPEDETGQLIAWGNRMVGNTDPEYADVLLEDAESDQYKHLPFRSPAALEVFAYGNELRRKRVGGNGDDLVSKLVNRIPEDGIALSDRDFNNYFLLLVVAGNETTRHAISHTMLALIQHPDQLELLKRNPELIPDAVEEFLRWASPVYHFRRTATRDVEVNGAEIRAGDKVTMWFASGNRDAEVFQDPYRFDVTRAKVDHVTFGKGGPHFCLGNSLARMEIR
ncbi:MAG: cytochrome P450, partial [Actinomycetota bacterium]|nr:cytochrome P450 [Actinomycetota bacterium]